MRATSVPAMRHRLIILLVVLLSAQSGWAAAAPRYVHEANDAEMSRFVHHGRTSTDSAPTPIKAQEAPAGQKSSTEGLALVIDLYHGHCDLAQIAVWYDVNPMLSIDDGWGAQHSGTSCWSSHIPDGLDRPERQCA